MTAPALRLSRFVLTGVAAILATVSTAADAAPIFETDFDGADGTIPADTTITEGTTANGAISGNEFRTSTGNVRLVYSGTGADALTDYTVETHFRRANGGGWTGLVARAQAAAGDLSGYFVRLNRSGVGEPHTLFQLYRLDAAGSGIELDTATLASQYPASGAPTWRMTLTVNGSTISAQLFDAADDLMAEVSATDAVLTAGTGGLRAQHGAVSVYQDLSIVEVPEPASLGLLGLGILAGVYRRR